MADLRFRQIHLDFHTSEQIPGIGSEFDPDEFADTLKAAHVNSVTCFSRCHHGWIYHDTARFPERRHPHLTRNLLKEQIDACHQRDIRVPIYITVMWDHFTARRHPEWIAIDETGRQIGT
ncbi:MAG TPA: beta-galactosidase, partial [Armatimonadota bacterium]|nr:beta-galactosidase [Armatimonadota bacterium]